MYRIEINIGKPDAPKWKIVRGTDSGPWGAKSLAEAQDQMHMWFQLVAVNGSCRKG